MTKIRDVFTGNLSRRAALRGMGATGALLAMPALLPTRAMAQAPGSSAGKYKVDLGGYNGPELSDQPLTLKFMRQDFPPAVNDTFTEAYAEFSAAYPNITIEEERVPYGDLPQKVQIYVASGRAPDIMMGRNDFAAAYAAGELALPINAFFTPEYIADLFAPLRESATFGGDLLCLPWETNPTFLYFNRDIFEAAGVETPPEVSDIQDGWTVDQYLSALDAITASLRAEGDNETYALAASTHGNGGPGSNYTQLESIWVRMMGDPAAPAGSSLRNTFLGVSEDGFTASGYLNTPEAIAGMQNYQSVFTKGYSPQGVQPEMYRGGCGRHGLWVDEFCQSLQGRGSAVSLGGVACAARGDCLFDNGGGFAFRVVGDAAPGRGDGVAGVFDG